MSLNQFSMYVVSKKRGFGRSIIFLILLVVLSSCSNKEISRKHGLNVFLNHILVTVDQSTYSSIVQSDSLKKIFASVRTRTAQPDNSESWSATYIHGQNTYMEMFSTSDVDTERFSGIAFGVETIGGVDSLYHSLPDSLSEVFSVQTMQRKTPDGQVPAFYFLTPLIPDSEYMLHIFVIEYDTSGVKYRFPDIDPQTVNITRRLHNSNRYRDDLLLQDIIECELALSEFDTEKLTDALNWYGYKLSSKEDSIIATGPDIKIIIRPRSEALKGICRIKFSLTDKQYKTQTIQFSNKSKLILNKDRTAEWFFTIIPD